MRKDKMNIERIISIARELDMNIIIVGDEGYGKTTQAKMLPYKTLNEILLDDKYQKYSLRYRIRKALGMPFGRDTLKGTFLIIDDLNLNSAIWEQLKIISDYTGLKFIIFTKDKKRIPSWIINEAIEYKLEGITCQEDLDFFTQQVLKYDIKIKYKEGINSLRAYKQIIAKSLITRIEERKVKGGVA